MFSVIIPAYNSEKFIFDAINSVLTQTISDFEIIVVDDGSCDKTSSVVKGIDDSRIRYTYQENGGVSVARNTGIHDAKGEYICFLDADDRWYPDHLETLTKLIKNYPECGMFLTGHAISDTAGKIRYQTEKMLQSVQEPMLYSKNGLGMIQKYGYFIHTNSICCTKTALDQVGGFEPGVKNGEDDDLWYRIFSYFPIAVSKHTTTVYRRDECGATAKRYFNADWVFEKRVPEILADPQVSLEVKKSLRERMETRKLSYVRYLLVSGEKRKAADLFWKLDISLLNRKKYIITMLSLLIPSVFISAVINYRDRNFYRQE